MKDPLVIYDWTAFLVLSLFTLMLLYQSWMNLAKGKLTSFSLDAWALLYLRLFRGKTSYERGKKLILLEPKRVKMFGICALLAAMGGIYVSFQWFVDHLLPVLQ